MSVLAIILVLSIGGMFVACCAWAPFSSPRQAGRKRVALFVGSGLAVVGAVGFFGSAVSAAGGLNWLPNSFEWPCGYVTGVVTTGNGLFVAPHTPSGRIQVYDAEWRFIRGWPVDAGGGTFKLRASGAEQIEVFTARGQWHYVFDDRGSLFSKEKGTLESYSSFDGTGQSVVVPTAPWLWVFSHPAISWAVLFMGMVVMGLVGRRPAKKGAA